MPIGYEYYAIYHAAPTAGRTPVSVMASEVTLGTVRAVLYDLFEKRWVFAPEPGARYLFDMEGQEEAELISRTDAERISRQLGWALPSEPELHRLILLGEADRAATRRQWAARAADAREFTTIFRFLIGESPEDLEPVFVIDGRDYSDIDTLRRDLDEAGATLDDLHLINGREQRNGGPGTPRATLLPSWAQWREQHIVQGEPIGVRPVTVHWAEPTGWAEMHAWLEQSHRWLHDQVSAAAASVPGADVETIADRGPRRIGPASALEPGAETYQSETVLLVVPPDGQPVPDALAVIVGWLRGQGWVIEEPVVEPDGTSVGATHNGHRIAAAWSDDEPSVTLMARSPLVDATHFAERE